MSKENNTDVIKMNPSKTEMKNEINEMSAEEFRRNFYTWFEENGLVSELRKNLRTQMVNTLKNSNLGKTVWDTNFTGPLKTQILNVLIAEYLVNMNYLFSLSVYSTEVPFISIFPECKSWLNESKTKANSKHRYFTEKKLVEILELLGFSTESEICKRIIQSYMNSEEKSALVPCIINLMSELSKVKWNPKTAEDANVAALNYEFLMQLEPWLKEIYTLLSNFEIPSNILYDVLTNLRKIFLREQEKIKIEETTNFNILQAKIQKDLQKKEFEIAAVVADLEQTYFEQKQRMLEGFAKEQSEVGATIENALKREAEYTKLLHSLKDREVKIQDCEKEVSELLDKLKAQVEILQDAYDAVLAENVKLNGMKGHNSGDMLYDNDSRELLRLEYEYLRKEVKATKDALQQFSKTIVKVPKKEKPSSVGLFMTKSAAERVQKENFHLVTVNKQLQQQVEELTNTNMELARELDIALRTTHTLANERKNYQSERMKFSVARSVEDKLEDVRKNEHLVDETKQTMKPDTCAIPTTQLVTPTPALHQNRSVGESSQTQARQHIRTGVQNSTQYRQTVPSRLIVHGESDSSPSRTPTEEVLQEARMRLRSLERATTEVENNYRAFRQRQLYEGLGLSSEDLTNRNRDCTFRHPQPCQFRDTVAGLRRKIPSTKSQCSYTNAENFPKCCVNTQMDVSISKINPNDYYTTVVSSNPIKNFEGSKEVSLTERELEPKLNIPAPEAAHDDVQLNPAPSSSDYRSSSVNSAECSGINIPMCSLSISSIDISSDYGETRTE